MLRRKRAQRSWKNMQKFEITVEKQVIVFLDVLSKEPMTHICQASLRGPINSVKHEFIVNLSARPIPTRQTPDYPCKSSLCHALLEFCDLILFGFPCSFPNKRFSLMLPICCPCCHFAPSTSDCLFTMFYLFSSYPSRHCPRNILSKKCYQQDCRDRIPS